MGTQVASFSGGSVELTLAANGDHFNFDSSDYVEITGLGKFDTVVFTSSSNAFELDNISVGAVPEPSTWAMMILGAELNACSAGRTNPILFCRCSHAHHAKCGARIEPAFDLTGARFNARHPARADVWSTWPARSRQRITGRRGWVCPLMLPLLIVVNADALRPEKECHEDQCRGPCQHHAKRDCLDRRHRLPPAVCFLIFLSIRCYPQILQFPDEHLGNQA
jgi:hypothetical protein